MSDAEDNYLWILKHQILPNQYALKRVALLKAIEVLEGALPPSSPVADRPQDDALTIACAELAGYQDGFEGLPHNPTFSTSTVNLAYTLWFGKARRCRSELIGQIDTLAALLKQSSPVADRPTWLPIETAPHDYQTVLLYLGNDAIATGFHNGHEWKVDGWAGPAPSHWMPLPSAPAASAGAADKEPQEPT